jgi:hypothetical protein
MIGFVIVFMPPMFLVLLSMQFLKAEQFGVFSWIQTTTEKADPGVDGHVRDPCRIWKKGWFRCFLISIVLTCLGWIPAVIFNFVIVVYYFVRMCKHGWH